MSRTLIYVHVYIILDFLITYRNALELCQSEFTCLHETVNMVVFFFKIMKIPNQKGENPCKLYRVVPQMKREKSCFFTVSSTHVIKNALFHASTLPFLKFRIKNPHIA